MPGCTHTGGAESSAHADHDAVEFRPVLLEFALSRYRAADIVRRRVGSARNFQPSGAQGPFHPPGYRICCRLSHTRLSSFVERRYLSVVRRPLPAPARAPAAFCVRRELSIPATQMIVPALYSVTLPPYSHLTPSFHLDDGPAQIHVHTHLLKAFLYFCRASRAVSARHAPEHPLSTLTHSRDLFRAIGTG